MNIPGCHNVTDFHRLAQRRIPFPGFDYFDGAAEYEITRWRNREAYESCDCSPSAFMRQISG